LSTVIRFALSRSREFLADAGSVELTKNPDAMITALRKIEGRGELQGATSAVMEMCVDNPREGFEDIFATHPPVQARIDALVKFAGAHAPGPRESPPAPEKKEPPAAQDEPAPAADAARGPDQPAGPWQQDNTGRSAGAGDRPFLPQRPPIEVGGTPQA